jgi:hypothetical protein
VIAKRVHLGKLLAGIEVQHRKGHVTEEGIVREPNHDIGVLAQRPQQRDAPQSGENLAQDKNALRFEFAER